MSGKYAELKGKQQRFADEYIIDLNATQAAIRAGYSKKTATEMGYENLSKPHVAEAIAKLVAERARKTQIDAAWVLREAEDLYQECRFEADRPQANKALDTIGKHVGVQAFKERIEVEGQIDIVEVLNRRIANVERLRPKELD